jgi:agmatinase
MKSDYVTIDELHNYDIAFVGIPLDFGASYRRGTALGPKSIREYSYWDAVNGEKFFDLQNENFIIANNFKIADVGDIHITPTDPVKSQKEITRVITEIRKQVFPLIVGGDHSITYSTIQGIIKALPQNFTGEIGVLHFDAHLDMENSYLDMPQVFHGNPFRCLIDEGFIKGENHYAIGQRGIIPSYLIEYVWENKIHLYNMAKIQKIGFDVFLKKIISECKERFKAIYITLDIDCLDPREVCGTGTPMEEGLKVIEMQRFLRSLKELPIIGFELVEVTPELDQSGLTSIIAANLLWNFLSFGLNIEKKWEFNLL